jgi:hypothetical protein
MVVNIIVSTLSLAGLWVLFYWPYREYRRDKLRTELFELRQDLFDLARNGDLEFSHPVYALLRTTINGFIRVGHEFNLVGALVFTSPLGPATEERELYHAKLRRLTADLPKATQAELEAIRERLNFLIIDHIVFTSLPLLALVVPALAVLSLRLAFDRIKRACSFLLANNFVERMDSAALAVGGE